MLRLWRVGWIFYNLVQVSLIENLQLENATAMNFTCDSWEPFFHDQFQFRIPVLFLQNRIRMIERKFTKLRWHFPTLLIEMSVLPLFCIFSRFCWKMSRWLKNQLDIKLPTIKAMNQKSKLWIKNQIYESIIKTMNQNYQKSKLWIKTIKNQLSTMKTISYENFPLLNLWSCCRCETFPKQCERKLRFIDDVKGNYNQKCCPNKGLEIKNYSLPQSLPQQRLIVGIDNWNNPPQKSSVCLLLSFPRKRPD